MMDVTVTIAITHLHAPFNDKSICFRKQNLPDPKVSEREMARARAAQAQGEAQDEE